MSDKRKEIVIEDNYYFVKWIIKKKELIGYIIKILLFNIISYVFICFYHTSDTARIFFAALFTDIICLSLFYLGIKTPYVRWKKYKKSKENYRDITLTQNKYRLIIMRIYDAVLIAAALAVVYIALFVKLSE